MVTDRVTDPTYLKGLLYPMTGRCSDPWFPLVSVNMHRSTGNVTLPLAPDGVEEVTNLELFVDVGPAFPHSMPSLDNLPAGRSCWLDVYLSLFAQRSRGNDVILRSGAWFVDDTCEYLPSPVHHYCPQRHDSAPSLSEYELGTPSSSSLSGAA